MVDLDFLAVLDLLSFFDNLFLFLLFTLLDLMDLLDLVIFLCRRTLVDFFDVFDLFFQDITRFISPETGKKLLSGSAPGARPTPHAPTSGRSRPSKRSRGGGAK